MSSGPVVHFELPYDDGDRARAFYAEAFGWETAQAPGMDYTTVSTGPHGASGPPTIPGYVNGGLVPRSRPLAGPTVVLGVEDLAGSLTKVEQAGGTVLLPSTPVGEIGYSAYFTDPEGNVIGLWQDA